jgi:hypothetical protein
MCYEDFVASWDGVQMCHLSCDSFSSELVETDHDADLKWTCTTYQSAWQSGVSAGGCGNRDQAKFWTNPQFVLSLVDVDKDDQENLVTVFVALMQKDTRLKRVQHKSMESCEEYIQFRLYKVIKNVFKIYIYMYHFIY